MSSDHNDFGWNYLNSKEPGSYNNDDGSWGYINDDGSASYHGADGSWGYRETDGSVSYHGGDGSWGYKNTDGSGSFYDSNGNSKYYDSLEENEQKDLGGSTTAKSDDVSFAQLLYAYSMMKEQADKERREAKRKEVYGFCRRHWKPLLILVISFLILIISLIGMWEFRKLMPVGYNANDLEGKHYEIVVDDLKGMGFENIVAEAVDDLGADELDAENTVFQILILGKDDFKTTSKYPYDIKIRVKYHAVKMISPPLSSKDAKKLNYKKVVEEFDKAGFSNIDVSAEYDLVTGWINSSGEISSITIDNKKKFDEDDLFRPDVEISIVYHEFKKKK